MQEFFQDLGLEAGKNYSPEDLKKAWHAQCLKTHPDKGGDKNAFLKVTHAYKMLTDPEYRFKEADRSQGQKADLTVRMQIPVDFEDWLFGRVFKIHYNRVEKTAQGDAVVKPEQEILSVDLDLNVIPANQPYLVPEYGLRCGDVLGDLIITVCPKPHLRFQVEGQDIVTTERVPLELMLKGGQLEVQTAYGIRTFTLNPGTQPGTRVALPGWGVRRRGAHVAVIDPIYPTEKDLKEKPEWKALDINWENHKSQEKKNPFDFDPDVLEQMFFKIKFNL